MSRALSLSDKQFIENQRKLGKSCQYIADSLCINLRGVYKWSARLKKTYRPALYRVAL